jgi:hypothetical protein
MDAVSLVWSWQKILEEVMAWNINDHPVYCLTVLLKMEVIFQTSFSSCLIFLS